MERVRGLAGLEEDVGVLGGAADGGPVRREPAGAEREHVVLAHERTQVLGIEQLDPVHLVAGAEAVEEVEERDPRAEGRRVGDEREVVRLLDRPGGEHRPAGRPRVHHVAVVAEDRQRVGRERPCRDVDDRRRQLAGDLEHVRDHQQQALRRGERRRERPGLQRAVERPGRAGLGLQLDDRRDVAPQVRPASGRPVVAVLGHR